MSSQKSIDVIDVNNASQQKSCNLQRLCWMNSTYFVYMEDFFFIQIPDFVVHSYQFERLKKYKYAQHI